jgi:hypothetical protein
MEEGVVVKELMVQGWRVPTVTVVVAVTLLVSPTAVRRYVLVEVSGPVETWPVGSGEEMMGVLACVIKFVMQFWVDQEMVEEEPLATDAGVALKEVMVQGRSLEDVDSVSVGGREGSERSCASVVSRVVFKARPEKSPLRSPEK